MQMDPLLFLVCNRLILIGIYTTYKIIRLCKMQPYSAVIAEWFRSPAVTDLVH